MVGSEAGVMPAGPKAASDRDANRNRQRSAASEILCDGAMRRSCVLGWPAEQPTGCQVSIAPARHSTTAVGPASTNIRVNPPTWAMSAATKLCFDGNAGTQQ